MSFQEAVRIKILTLLGDERSILPNKYTKGVSTYQICRQLNSVINRRFCHKFRRERQTKNPKKNKYKEAIDPTGDCSNDTTNCCHTSFREVYTTLKALEREKKINSIRAKAPDIKRYPNYVQISRDTYRFWFVKYNERLKNGRSKTY